jgi:hypothetical protein
VTVEDRLRATTQAVTAAMGPVRPLDLSGDVSASPVHDPRSLDLLDGQPLATRRNHGTRRWLTWGAPVAAAALVTALALVLVMLRHVPAPQSGPDPTTSGTAAPAAFPRYYVALTSADPQAPVEAVVADDQTGRRLAVIPPFAGQVFSGVTAAADDRTFVLSSYQATRKSTVWYLLRLTPGAGHPAQLTRLPVKPLTAEVTGLALSPDGRELAVMGSSPSIASEASTELLTYSLSSGAELGAWRTGVANELSSVGTDAAGLSWVNGDRGVAFRWSARLTAVSKYGAVQVRTVDLTAAGHDLLADSRVVLQLPAVVDRNSALSDPCGTSLAASNGRAVVCGVDASGNPAAACPGAPPSFVSYSTATGQPLNVLYHYAGPCTDGISQVLWTDQAGSRAIGLLVAWNGKKLAAVLFGVVAAGRLTPLPDLITGADAAWIAVNNPGTIAF